MPGLRKLFAIALLLCLGIPVLWMMNNQDKDLVQISNSHWIPKIGNVRLLQDENDVPKKSNAENYGSYDKLLRLRAPRSFYNNRGVKGLDPRVLLVYWSKYSSSTKSFRQVQNMLLAQHIKHELFAMSSSDIPNLVDFTSGQAVGRYSLIIICDSVSFISDDTFYELFTEYSKKFGAATVFIMMGNEKGLEQGKMDVLTGSVMFSRIHRTAKLDHLRVHETQDFKYFRDGGKWFWSRNVSDLVVFYPQISLRRGEIKSSSNRFQELISAQFISQPSQPVALIDWGSGEQAITGFIGVSLITAVGKLVFLETIHLISSKLGKQVLRFLDERFIQIDVDDVFFAPAGLSPTEDDIKALIDTQVSFQRFLPGFKFNLGFCGSHFQRGSEAESRGNQELIKNAEKFSWFGHTYSHVQPHKLTLSQLVDVMNMNKKFAKEHGIPLPNTQYSVSPHHSGIYPVHEPLYEAWKRVWNISVTSTEEYPHLKPPSSKRGFVHSDIMVLPRQTCGIYTKTSHFSNFPNRRKTLVSIAEEGEVFVNILNNPVAVFMTHYNNYGSDRLALELFQTAFKFLEKWTKLKLSYAMPSDLGIHYFSVFPEDKAPLWTSPCSDKRHMEIWSLKNCSRLPSLLVLGPQKTGSTALHFFLKQHPQLFTNTPTKHAFEEVQFFSSEKYYSKGIDWYMSNFPIVNETNLLFEKSATYFTHPSTPERIHALVPGMKFAVILADPIRRAYSWYQHMRSHNDPTALKFTFEEVIQAKKGSDSPLALLNLRSRCLTPGIYHQHLERWLELFKPEQMHFVDGEELVMDPSSVLLRIIQFLGLQPYDYQEILKFSPRKGFYCIRDKLNKEVCLGISKGRKYPNIAPTSVKYLRKFYSHPNRLLYSLLLKLSRKSPSWLTDSF